MNGTPAMDGTNRTDRPILAVSDLVVEFRGKRGQVVVANDHLSLDIQPGETLGIVGESGSGKSVFCRAVLRLLPSPPAQVRAKSLLFDGRDLMRLSEREMRGVRGQDIAMIFQNPMSSLNPVWPIGDQVAEPLRLHKGMARNEARAAAIELLRRVGIPSPEKRVDDYPYQWSGGMMQRAVIAMALAGAPKLMLADEPTTALDVTIQDQILSLLLELQRESGMSLVLVSHDMGVIAETCDRVVVMYAGRIVELASTPEIFDRAAHPYTQALLRSIPRLDNRTSRLSSIPGQPPDLAQLGIGCSFAERCPMATADCRSQAVDLRPVGTGHLSACLYPDRVAALAPVAS
ncbi:MAG: peptide/nickel transport system ATP-binding protein [Rhodospirillaceae bacterium]|jgi:oligopeptide/dipeptide ABC transporter ATP-binding protein|nr:peptide/nickel transport system ATP-binding protein [Rhodospirillaceae bacterium]